MSQTNFIDHVKIYLTSGHGGAGSRHFHRSKISPRGGPDGGDGGRGGHIILEGNSQLWTLLHLKYRKHITADNGQSGSGQNKTGITGEDIIIEVPLGTTVKNEEGEKIMEITEHGERKILLSGGRGGLGNQHFATATRQTPRFAQPGEDGIEGWYVFELKVLADVGLVGFPNAGKSTLLSVVSAARPEIADYPFTTLTPNLGVVAYRDYKSFIIADIPGIIEGAHLGKGLGHRFLRHIERNALLLFMVPADSRDIRAEYEILLEELRKYNPELLYKERILAVSKADLLDGEMEKLILDTLPADIVAIFISAITGKNIQVLKDLLWRRLQEENG
ncbi:MAG: GTPase ObgE [Bacteroidota bacterium]|nr:GTPase ObgE [Bacteroidota bacterium]